jgi:hypothetical protein
MKPDPETINMMLEIAELAVLKRDIDKGDEKPYISFREASRRYGAGVVKGWRDQGSIIFLQDGPNKKIRIDRMQLEAVAKASNRGL